MNELPDDLDTRSQFRIERTQALRRHVVRDKCIVDVPRRQLRRTQCEEQARRIDRIKKRPGVTDHHPAVATGLAVQVCQLAPAADRLHAFRRR